MPTVKPKLRKEKADTKNLINNLEKKFFLRGISFSMNSRPTRIFYFYSKKEKKWFDTFHL